MFGVVLGLMLVPGVAGPVSGQSLLARGGLGLVAEPLTARARALGGVGLGLPDANLSLVNPAGIAGIPAPALHVTFQPDYYSTEFSGGTTSGSTSRFPLLRVALPLGERWAVSLGYGSFLDQNWAVEQQDSILVGGEMREVRDRFASRGGVARLRIGGAYSLTEELSLGLGVDIHTGSARDTIVRSFISRDTAGLGLIDNSPRPAGSEIVRNYSGLSYAAGARWTPSEALMLAAALTIGGTLDAEPGDTILTTRSYDLPLQASLGGSARVTANTLVALSTRWAGWSSADAGLAGGDAARDSWAVAGGIEWDAINFGDQVLPLRIGGRVGSFPFAWRTAAGESGFIDERTLTGGFGLRLAQGAARADLAVERGERSGGGIGFDESFWRLAVSLTVLGR